MLRFSKKLFASTHTPSTLSPTFLTLRGGSTSDPASSIKGPCIGIDLGTTYSCVGVWRNNRVEICVNEQGHRITPSYVSWSKEDGTRSIGDAAKTASPSNPQNTVFDAKRLIGRKYKDASVQKDKKLFPFEVCEGGEGKAAISVDVKGQKKTMSPEEVSGMVSIALSYKGKIRQK